MSIIINSIKGLFEDDEYQPPIEECAAPAVVASDLENENVRAFLMMTRLCEGTEGINGYRMMFGKKLFNGFEAHPNVLVKFKRLDGGESKTTAAGAYQFLFRTWEMVRVRLGLSSFSPINQDRAAIELIRLRGALVDVKAGRWLDAVRKCSPEWASLPFAPAEYSQPKRDVEYARQAYLSNGGKLS